MKKIEKKDKLKKTEKVEETLAALKKKLGERTRHIAGYPCNSDFDYSALWSFLQFPLNNLGDPFQSSNYQVNTHKIERNVLRIFCEITQASFQHTWGHVTHGGTEGNMYSMYLARELYPKGVVYYSEDTHYSVSKIMRVLKIRSIMIRSKDDGTIDYDDLKETIRIHRDCPPIVFCNIGTTMKGAIDSIPKVRKILEDLAIKQFYIHADAALSGMILPFVDDPEPFGFSAGIDGISISGHKMIGSPIPCGVVLVKKSHVDRIARSVEYVGTLDTTLAGSRNGLTPLILWYALTVVGRQGMKKQIKHCFEMADYTISELKKYGYQAWRHKNSITVVFPRPSDRLIKKWQLAAENEWAHIITMPQITKVVIQRLIKDIVQERKNSHEKNNYRSG